jgi:hypothetical protein
MERIYASALNTHYSNNELVLSTAESKFCAFYVNQGFCGQTLNHRISLRFRGIYVILKNDYHESYNVEKS